MRILLVEDDKDLCQALLIHFKDQGYDTDICNNGTDYVITGPTGCFMPSRMSMIL